jgi:hypothetical protein
MTPPAPFERIPLRWERAFGGWDRSHTDPKKHDYDRRNPVGVGFRVSGSRFEEGLRAPNIEDPMRLLREFGDRVTPAGFGFLSANWEPRSNFAGTYGEKWEKERSPLLPKDFNRRFFNAAPPGLVAQAYLRGDEPVVATGVNSSGGFGFKLPVSAAPRIRVEHVGREDARRTTNLDTVIVDADGRKLFLLWRTQFPVQEPTAVRTIEVTAGEGSSQKAAA